MDIEAKDDSLLPDGNFTITDTIDMQPEATSKRLSMPEQQDGQQLDKFIEHLSDACPLIAYHDDEDDQLNQHARYIMGHELGSGAIGQVIDAHDEHLTRNIAIKILRDSGGIDRERIARFIAEAQITAQLEHPTIVPVHEIGRMPGGMPYFTMKKVRGKSLSAIINQLRITPPRQRKYSTFHERFLLRRFVQLCFGLAYAHSRGVVHRDLKPDNIMIGEYGEVQIMDWGLAKIMNSSDIFSDDNVHTIRHGDAMRTLEGSIAGTPSYMSPEQASGAQDMISPASDIFSLGLVLAEMLTLVRVFRHEENPSHLLYHITHCGPIEASSLKNGIKIAKELEAIIRKCTMNNPKHRYQSMDEVADDIRAYLENREVSAERDTTHKKLLKWTMRNRLTTGVAIGVGAAILIGMLIKSVF